MQTALRYGHAMGISTAVPHLEPPLALPLIAGAEIGACADLNASNPRLREMRRATERASTSVAFQKSDHAAESAAQLSSRQA